MGKRKGRTARVKRQTSETVITAEVNLDGSGDAEVNTGIGFLDHMLTLFAKHGIFDLKLKAEGDLEIDIHHTNEDTGIVLGQAFAKALGDKKGIRRFGSSFVPMDEALSRVRIVLDISGRPSLFFDSGATDSYFAHRNYTIQDARELIRAFTLHSGINIHVDVIKGDDPHHILESVFKAWGRSMREAVDTDKRIKGVPSTKGMLDK